MKPRFIVADELRAQKAMQATSGTEVEVLTFGGIVSPGGLLDELLAEGDEFGKNELNSYTV